MGLLHELDVVSGTDNKASTVFENLEPDFRKVKYKKSDEYIKYYWQKFQNCPDSNNNLNGKVFEYILSTLFIREKLLPFFIEARVAFVPNVIYDMMFYTTERGPICISAKTSLRERYKQADLEAIALKYVHRKSLCYLITLNSSEADSVNEKIKKGDVIGLDKVILADSNEFNKLIEDIRSYNLIDSPNIKVIQANHVITEENLRKIK